MGTYEKVLSHEHLSNASPNVSGMYLKPARIVTKGQIISVDGENVGEKNLYTHSGT